MAVMLYDIVQSLWMYIQIHIITNSTNCLNGTNDIIDT